MILNPILGWIKKIKGILITYRDGFWHLPIRTNHPQEFVNKLAKLPLSKHNKVKQLLTSSNPIFSAFLYYEQVEEGFWIMLSSIEYNVNVVLQNEVINREAEFYTLRYNINNPVVGKRALLDGESYNRNGWLFNKPSAIQHICHLKNDQKFFMIVMFSKSWLTNQWQTNKAFADSRIKYFLKSTNGYMLLPNQKAYQLTDFEYVKGLFEKGVNNTKQEIGNWAYTFVDSFLHDCQKHQLQEEQFSNTEINRKKLQEVRMLLNNSIENPFPGITYLASIIGMSPTVLKAEFKSTTGMTCLEYFQVQKVQRAKEILGQNTFFVKDIALKLGYKNESKFIAVFKKHTGQTPTEYLKGATQSALNRQ